MQTFTRFLRQEISSYINTNLVGMLVFYPELGVTDSLTNAELLLRLNLTMPDAAAKEFGASNLNGYKRHIVVPTITELPNQQDTSIKFSVSFTATSAITPVTHIVVARNANLIGATASNGNNRANTQGTVLLIDTLPNASIVGTSIPANTTATTSYNLSLNTLIQ